MYVYIKAGDRLAWHFWIGGYKTYELNLKDFVILCEDHKKTTNNLIE